MISPFNKSGQIDQGWRLSEKSFEIRFCAAFSVVHLPFIANPQWFGLTQAEEAELAFDTMLKEGGGRLILFQFKAKQKGDGRFSLDREQWDKLSNIDQKYSAYYVFPEFATVGKAAAPECLLKHSWLCDVAELGKAFRGEKTAKLSLEISQRSKHLSRNLPKKKISVKNCCAVFGCECFPHGTLFRGPFDYAKVSFLLPNGRKFIRKADFFLDSDRRPAGPVGIPVGDVGDKVANGDQAGSGKVEPLMSYGDFERLLGRGGKAFRPGLYGLFILNQYLAR